MKIKKLFLLFVLAGAMPLSMMAQDDDPQAIRSSAEKRCWQRSLH